jgi:serine/threonine protein kinase
MNSGGSKGKRFRFFLPKRKINEDEMKKSRSIIRTLKQSRLPPAATNTKTNTKTISVKETNKVRNVLFNQSIKFFSTFTSSHLIRKKFGVQRILQELQRSTVDYETYGSFFFNQDNWMITPVPEMDLTKDPQSPETSYRFEPECLLGVGGQGCVFLGRFIDSTIQGSYAFKIRMRTKSAINSGTTSSPGRRRSPGFRNVDGGIKEELNEDPNSGRRAINFIDDTQQESLHREAVAAFRVYSQSKMKPQPLMYGYNAKLDFEVFVMEIMDFTLNDFIRGTTWKTRMDCLGEVWASIKDSFDSCSQSGIVHYDIKPENLGLRITKEVLEAGLLDYGISKSQGYSLDKFIKGSKVHRAPGTVTYMSPRSHLWKPMSWMDDFLTSFFSMFVYSTVEGKSSFEKISGVRKFRAPLSPEDRKQITPESLAVFCLRNPPWSRFPYGSVQTLKKKQNESVVKEEVSLAMLKIHAMTHPTKIDDIVSILLNIDGFLDDTAEMQQLTDNQREEFSNKAAQTLQTILVKQMGKFHVWWLEFSMEVRRLIDQFWESTEESYRDKSYQTIFKLLKTNVSSPDDIIGLIDDSSYGRKLIEANLE